MRLRSCLVEILLLLGLIVELIDGEYNCTHRYVVTTDGSFNRNLEGPVGYCEDSCLQSTPALEVSADPDCALLHHVLPGYNSFIVDGDCLELQFMSGEYWFSSLSQIQLSYSLVLTAPWGGVSIACNPTSHNTCNTGGKGESSPGASVKASFMMAVNGSQDRDVFVSINSLAFSNCPERIKFNFLTNLTVTNSSFIGFSSSALDLFNVDYAVIQDTVFKDCISKDTNAQFRGNGGGLSAAYYYTNASSGSMFSRLEIVGCRFENNSAYRFSLDHNTQALLSIISGRGGGIVLFPQDLSNTYVLIKDSMFVNNRADEFGGGIWTGVYGQNTYHDFVLENCVFLGNHGEANSGGGIQMALLLRNANSPRPIRIVLTGCHFEENFANFGGGLSVTEVFGQGRGNEVSVSDTQFVRNRASSAGAAVMFQTFSYVQNRLERFYYDFTDCVFQENEAVGGTFGAGFNSVKFFGNILFSGNVGPALRLVGALLEVYGNLCFVGNSVPSNVEGGAMFIQAFGQVKMYSNTSLQFTNNFANRTGAAIVVDVQRSSPVFSELIYNPQCFLIYEDPIAQPIHWENVSISFSGNQAAVGPAVFISHLKHCSWYSSDPVGDPTINKVVTVFSPTLFPNWTAFNFETTNMALSHKGDPYDRRFYIQTEPLSISSSVQEEDQLTIRPGQTTPVNLTALDQFGNPTYLIARVADGRRTISVGAFSQAGRRDEDINSESTLIVFDPSLLPVDPAVGVADLMYGYSERDDLDELQEDPTIPVSIDTPFFNVLGVEAIYFNMTLSPCQPGYELTEVNGIYTCDCSRRAQYILTCNENVIVLRDGTWAGRELEQGFPHLDITLCPASYCSCQLSQSAEICANLYRQDSNDPNEQCHATRQGTLCGECVNGLAVGVLRTNCRECKGNKYYTVALLVLADLLVLGMVFFTFMKLEFHFPHSLKGLLFYVQTAYYVTESFPASFWDVRKYMLYVSSALSLYFPYDFCLSPGTDALTTFGLKFIPPSIAFLLCLAVVIGVYVDRSRISRAGRRHVWRVLWFLLLLFYAPLLHTCTAILKCPVTPSASGDKESRRWYFNGEVQCFHDPVHIVLSVVAILVLTALVLLIPAICIFIITTNYMKFRYRTVEWIEAALGEGYRDCLEARLYAVWELIRRLLLVSIVVAAPGRSVGSAYVVIASFGVHVFFNPYQKLFQNLMETLVLLNYIIFLLVRSNETILSAVNSGSYSGNLIPSSLGKSLSPVDNVAWLFIPPFYLPLLVAAIFSLGALVYRITKTSRQWRHRKQEKAVLEGDYSGLYFNAGHTKTVISRTTVAIDDDFSASLNNSLL